MKRFAREEPSR